jgi:exodeoxyribonuclease V alpha subunit
VRDVADGGAGFGDRLGVVVIGDARDVADGSAGFGDGVGVVVVGDAHLLDVETAAAVLEAVPEGTRVVLAGDPAEPGPAGAGRVLGDLLDARLPRVRAADRAPHPITDLRFAVRGGELPPPEPDPERRLVVVPAHSPDEAVHRGVQLVADSIPRAFGLRVPDILVVAPARDGGIGTAALNAALKARLNPGHGRWHAFDPGDRVIAVRPLPHGPRAGATGTLVDVTGDGALVRWDGHDEPVPLPAGAAAALRHGWALTVRQAAGGAWPAVVAVFAAEAPAALSRATVYGAFGLARVHLSVVHAAGPALAAAVAAADPPRRTRLPLLLRDA